MKKILLVVLLVVCCAGSILGRRMYELAQGFPVNHLETFEYGDGVRKGDKFFATFKPYRSGIGKGVEKTGLVDIAIGTLKWETIPGYFYRQFITPDFRGQWVSGFNPELLMQDQAEMDNYTVYARVAMRFTSSLKEFQWIQDQDNEELLYRWALRVRGLSGLAVATLADPNTYLAVLLIASLAGPFLGRKFKDLKKTTNQGHAMVQYNLGVMYSKGQGVPQNYTKALKWARKAADQGDDKAQVNLGLMYSKGQGVPQNYAKALKWYTKAAELGNAGAQSDLARMYVSGEGVLQNYKEAFKWYTKAAEHGDANAQYGLGGMYIEGWGVPCAFGRTA